MARRPRRKAEETREDILSTAETLFRRQGFSGVAISDIAGALEMSPANVFKHFHSKTVLADAIAERHISRLTERLASADKSLAAPDRLMALAKRLMEGHLKDLHESPYIFEMVLMTAQSDFPSAMCYKQLLEENFAEIIRDGVASGFYHCSHPEVTARAVSAALVSVLHPVFLVKSEPDELPERCSGLVNLINAALQNPLAK